MVVLFVAKRFLSRCSKVIKNLEWCVLDLTARLALCIPRKCIHVRPSFFQKMKSQKRKHPPWRQNERIVNSETVGLTDEHFENLHRHVSFAQAGFPHEPCWLHFFCFSTPHCCATLTFALHRREIFLQQIHRQHVHAQFRNSSCDSICGLGLFGVACWGHNPPPPTPFSIK